MLGMRKWVVGLCVGLGCAANAVAATSVIYDPGTTQVTTGLAGFSTNGAQMDGMEVTVSFFDGSSSVGIWADTGASSGAASGTGWLLSESGDTFGGTWILTNSSLQAITRVLIDGAPGSTVFDVGDASLTAGSANGMAFNVTSDDSGLDIVATYRDQVALSGDAPLGDVWRKLDIAFNGSGFAPGVLNWSSDTDNLKIIGDITPEPPEPPVIPLPAGVWAGLVMLGGVGASQCRRSARA